MICKNTTKSFIEIPPWAKKVIFITEFSIWCKNPPFYEVKKFFHKWLCAWRNCFLDHFSSSFLGRKYHFQVHIPFWLGTPKLNQWRIRLLMNSNSTSLSKSTKGQYSYGKWEFLDKIDLQVILQWQEVRS